MSEKTAEKIDIVQTQPQRDISFSDGNIFSSSNAFMMAQRMAQALASSTIIPKEDQGNIGNCMIALEMSSRLHTSPMMVMQNLYIVNGRPAWSSQYIVAMINSSKKYQTELQYEMTGTGDTMACFAFTFDAAGRKVTGPTITMQMAKDEGWTTRNGSKWKTMPEVMIRYRAASFFGRLNCPDMIMGIYTTDEVIEIGENDYTVVEATAVKEEIKENGNKKAIDVEITQEPEKEQEETPKEEKSVGCDPETGEVYGQQEFGSEEANF